MEKIHALNFPEDWERPKEKKIIDYLYIEADEDHISLQYRDEKGDLQKSKRGSKNNNAITKLIYVHEGVEPEAPKSVRHRLINPHYFSRTAEGISNTELWDGVYRYLDAQYDLSKVKRIFLSSDGGKWIMSGMRQISGLIHVLDRYHLEQQLTRLTAHMKDGAADARTELYRVICNGTKAQFTQAVWRLKDYLPEGANTERFDESGQYILNNWTAAKRRLQKIEGKVGSSTEGHVSHVLSSRMSTAALGWSLHGADKMAQLRAYYLNGGDMLELIRYQKTVLPKVAGAETVESYLSVEAIRQSEKNRHGIIGKYVESMRCSVIIDPKKQVDFICRIWKL